MQRRKAYVLLLTVWYCLPLVEREDGTLPLPHEEQSLLNLESKGSLWDLLCL